MPLGIITTLVREKRYGFIAPDDGGADVYFRAHAVVGGTMEPLSEGDRVLFEVESATPDDARGPRARLVAPYTGRPPEASPAVEPYRSLRRHPSSRAKKPTWRKG
ncbi:MAG TPA: cold shock domain-containing protein [Pirellulales bacterium]